MTGRADPLAGREPTVSAGLVRAMRQFALAQGVPGATVDAPLGEHAARLSDPDHRVPASVYDAAYRACSSAVGGADFGLRAGLAARASQLGVLGFLLAASRSFGAALEAYQRYQATLGETLALQLVEAGAHATLAIRSLYGLPGDALRVESTAAAVHVLVQELCGCAVPWRAASFEHLDAGSGGARADALQRVLGVRPTRGPNRLHFDAAALAWPILHDGADDALASALHAQLAQRTRALGAQALAPRVAALLRRGLATGRRPSVAALARELGLGGRVLQQRLQAEGTSVRALADAVGRDAAFGFLRGGASAAEVAHLLGFAEEAAFFRAFRRWTGRTPAQWRADAVQSGR